MNIQEFQALVFQAAQEQGLKDYDLYYQKTSTQEYEVYQGEIEKFSGTTVMGACFRCLLEGHMGYSSTQRFSQEDARNLVEQAVESARAVESKDPQFLYDGSLGTAQSLKSASGRAPAAQDMRDAALELERLALAEDSRIQEVSGCQVAYEEWEIHMANSRGMDLSRGSQVLVAYVEDMAKVEGKPLNAYAVKVAETLDGLDLKACARLAAENTLGFVGAKSIPSGTYPVVFSSKAMISLLDTFSGVFSADNAQRGLSLLGDQVGKTIASDALTLVDDPLYAGCINKVPFDAEGVPTHRKAVVEGGVLTTLLHNLKTAAKAGVPSTGNACKWGYTSPVGVAPSNFYVQPGTLSREELFQAVGEGLLITELRGLHAGANAQSGDFSLECRGYRITGGQKGAPVDQIVIASNFYELLKQVVAVGDDLEFGTPGADSCFGSPSVWVRGAAIAGQEDGTASQSQGK